MRRRAIFSVPVLGGDERLVVENAFSPAPLPDGSLLIVKLNSEGRFQLHRFWPANGRLEALPIHMSQNVFSNRVRAFPGRQEGRSVGRTSGSVSWTRLLCDRSCFRFSQPSRLARSGRSGWWQELHGFARWEVDFEFCAFRRAHPDLSFPGERRRAETQLLTVTNTVWFLEAGPGESFFANMVDRPVDIVRFAPDGTRPERLATFPLVPDQTTMTILPDGRAVVPVRAASQLRLVAVQKGKDPAPLVNTTEETAAPVAACGPREVAFMIGPEPHETIAFAEPASGRLVRTIAPAKGPVESITCSPDGKTVYFAARGVIWSAPSSGLSGGGEARKIRAGDVVVADPSGRRLIVQVQESSQLHRFSVPLDGGPEREIPPDSSIPISPIALSPNALNADGRLLTSLLLRDSWFNPPGLIDTATGRTTRIPSDNLSDYQSVGWTPDGQVMAFRIGVRATLWKFQPMPR